MNLFDQLNQSSYVFYFLVVDDFLDIQLPQLQNFHLIYASKNPSLPLLKSQNLPYFCLEETGTKLPEKNSGRLLSQPQVIEYIQSTSLNRIPVIIPFKPSAKIEVICRQQNWICAAVSHQLNRFLEDKNEFFNFCQKNNLPTIPSIVDKFNQENFIKFQKQFGQKLVIQTHFGWAGKSTFFADSWEQIQNKIPSETNVKFSPFVEGYSLLNNCCLTSNGLIQSPPALQYTGIKPLTSNPFTTVGRQWPSMAPEFINQKVVDITSNFGQIIKGLGYLGFFGLDFMVSDNQVYLLECNPRLTASFAFYTKIEITKSLTPLFLFHLIQFLDLKLDLNVTQIQEQVNQSNITGSEITLKNENSQTINKYQDFTAFSQQTNPIIISPSIINRLYEKK